MMTRWFRVCCNTFVRDLTIAKTHLRNIIGRYQCMMAKTQIYLVSQIRRLKISLTG